MQTWPGQSRRGPRFERYFLSPGDSILPSRGVPHSHAHLSDGVGRIMDGVIPAGSFEQLLEDSRQAGPTATPEEIAALVRKHGMKGVGPPIDLASLKRDAAD